MMFYIKYAGYLLLYILMLGAVTLSFKIKNDGITREYDLDGWLESDYNFVVVLLLVVSAIMCFLNYYME